MANEKLDGRDYINQSVEILNKVHDQLSGLAGQLDAAQIPGWQGKIKALVDDTPIIMEKLFVKTQGGTRQAQQSLEKIQALESAVAGVSGQSVDEATKAVGEAVDTVDKNFGAFIHKSKTHIIRMT